MRGVEGMRGGMRGDEAEGEEGMRRRGRRE